MTTGNPFPPKAGMIECCKCGHIHMENEMCDSVDIDKVAIESTAVVREIHFKADEEEAAKACLDMLDRLGKVLATNIVDEKWIIIARFDDGLDYLAFLAAIGAVKVKGATDGS